MGNAARCVKMQAQAFESVSCSTGRPLHVRTATGGGTLTEGLETTITFVFATLISMCNVAQ